MDTKYMITPEVQILRLNKDSGFEYRKRREDDWQINYELYRDKVRTNRFTQRQSVNLPLMKQSIRTLLKDVDDPPVLHFESINNDELKETYINEHWKDTSERNKLELRDIVDKRQVFLFGRSFKSLNVVDGYVKIRIEDPQDILVGRFTDPTDIDSAEFLIHTGMYKPLRMLKGNDMYDQEAVERLIQWHATDQGIIRASQNEEMRQKRNEKMEAMGMEDVDSPILGETFVELCMHFVWEEVKGESQIVLKIEADDMELLCSKPLEEVLGVTTDNYWRKHFPYTTWGDDVENQDFWSDSVADVIRPANIVLNAFYSQLIENRTLRNMNMHYYDSTDEGFQPQTFEPKPWGWYPVGGDPNKVVKDVMIGDLSESLDEMQFITGVIEKASGATATQQGTQIERQVTLGEVQLALGEAKERVKGMSKFYTPAWKETGEKYLKLVEGSADKLNPIDITKKGRNTDDLFSATISPEDFLDKAGFLTRVWSQDEKNAKDIESLEKFNVLRNLMPDNPKLAEIHKRKSAEWAGLTPDEINSIMEFEQQKMEMLQQGQVVDPATGVPMQIQPSPEPMNPQVQPPINA